MTKFSNTRKGQLTEEEREKYREWGRQGGKKVHEIYGSEHMAEIGSVGYANSVANDAPRASKPAKVKKSPRQQPKPVQPDNLEDFI